MLAAYVGHGAHPPLNIGYFDNQLGNFISAGTTHFNPQDNDTLYRFNSLGYRSAEFDPHTRTKIFVCGCSYTFGMGVPYEETWPIHLARLVATERHLSERDVAVQNFSQIGASNDYIARTIVQQCERARPDLAVIAFTHLNRAEYLAGTKIANLGHWNLAAPRTADTKPGKDYFRHYNDQYGLLTTLKNMHWVQSAMQARGIPFVFAWIDFEIFRETSMWKNPEILRLRNLIDMSRFCQCSIKEAEIMADVVDGHPGPRSHRSFASKIFETMQGSATKSSVRRESPDKRRRFSGADKFITALMTRFAVLTQRSGQSRDLIVGPKFSDSGKYLRDIGGKFGNNKRIISCLSDDAIARRLIAICEVERPNFACAWFSGAAVYEHVDGPDIVELAECGTKNASIAEWSAYFTYMTAELRVVNLLKNILVVQEYLSAKKIPYRLVVPHLCREQLHPVAAILMELINFKVIVEGTTRRTLAKPVASKSRIGNSNRSSNQDPNIYPLW